MNKYAKMAELRGCGGSRCGSAASADKGACCYLVLSTGWCAAAWSSGRLCFWTWCLATWLPWLWAMAGCPRGRKVHFVDWTSSKDLYGLCCWRPCVACATVRGHVDVRDPCCCWLLWTRKLLCSDVNDWRLTVENERPWRLLWYSPPLPKWNGLGRKPLKRILKNCPRDAHV